MKILGIETSCDETACAIVEDGQKVLKNVIASQIDLHAKTGGVVPEVAAREHVLQMIPVLDETVENWDEIDAVAVTQGPGLVSSLIIGTEAANVISHVKKKPLIPVQHIVGHIYSNWLDLDDGDEIEFPVLVLTVSGGHNELILMRGHDDFEVLGETRDDAAGEAFDKVARMLGLGYPGGPAIAREAESGDAGKFALPRILLEKDSLDFSFSGLKTAVLNESMKFSSSEDCIGSTTDVGQTGNVLRFRQDLAASFQEAVVEVLAEKLFRAYRKFPDVKELHLAGGVSANLRLREVISAGLPDGVKFRHPKTIRYCTDNAAMIAAAGYFLKDKAIEIGNIVPDTSFEIW